MTLSFGTDGVRGRAYDEISVEDVEHLGAVAAQVLGGDAMVIGTDTRVSGPDFVDAIARGVTSQGIIPWLLGDGPTPAVARAAADLGIAGAMVSASHNPFHDNGVKFFAPGGRKLTDAQQADIERRLTEAVSSPVSASQPTAVVRHDLVDSYGQWVQGTVDGRSLDGLRLVVDCANGAASAVAPDVLAALGADVVAINNQPNGRNINDQCGSTHMQGLREFVVASNADLGVAFDGDADRMLALDSSGDFIDGDQIIAICALDRKDRGELVDDTVVVTVMTNLGFHQGMLARGVHVHQTPVGDRHVLQALEEHQWSLGGEQSGHVIFADLATTGDGLLSAVQLLDVVKRSGETLSELADQAMRRLPQRLRNVTIDGTADRALQAVADDLEAVEEQLGENGRLLVRPSGTEPLIRVMAEAPTQDDADWAVGRIVTALQAYTTSTA
jgi:phosphoglucosamine mutase